MQQQLDIVTSGGVSIPPPDNQPEQQLQLRDIQLAPQQPVKLKWGNARAAIWTDEMRLKYKLDDYKQSLSTAINTRGKRVMMEYLNGTPISRDEAIIAKCGECMAWHFDGIVDCQAPLCPLYLWMPYNKANKLKRIRKNNNLKEDNNDLCKG
jgi:hypothetical protein